MLSWLSANQTWPNATRDELSRRGGYQEFKKLVAEMTGQSFPKCNFLNHFYRFWWVRAPHAVLVPKKSIGHDPPFAKSEWQGRVFLQKKGRRHETRYMGWNCNDELDLFAGPKPLLTKFDRVVIIVEPTNEQKKVAAIKQDIGFPSILTSSLSSV